MIDSAINDTNLVCTYVISNDVLPQIHLPYHRTTVQMNEVITESALRRIKKRRNEETKVFHSVSPSGNDVKLLFRHCWLSKIHVVIKDMTDLFI